MKNIFKWFHRSEKGFTLIELLVVIAILGILAAVAIPNVSKFIGRGKTEAQKTELKNVELAVTAAMAEANAGTIGGTEPHALDKTHDITIGATTITVGDQITGTYTTLNGTYSVMNDGSVTQTAYP